jgi:type II secretion system protein G
MSSLTKRRLLMLVANTPRQRSLLQKGFTLVELMIVVVIVGILSAIALPNFLNQQNKAKATCAKTQVSALAKEQQVYYAENSSFAADATTLGTTLPAACNGYGQVALSATAITAAPTDTTNGYYVRADLSNGSFKMCDKKSSAPTSC